MKKAKMMSEAKVEKLAKHINEVAIKKLPSCKDSVYVGQMDKTQMHDVADGKTLYAFNLDTGILLWNMFDNVFAVDLGAITNEDYKALLASESIVAIDDIFDKYILCCIVEYR